MSEVVARTEQELVQAVREADAAGAPVRIRGMGGGDASVDEQATGGARIVRVATRDLVVNDDDCGEDALAFCGAVQVAIGAGWPWDEFVAMAVERDWVGVERLSGCPGSVGGVTVANVARFGQSVAQSVAAVRTWDRADGAVRRFAAVDCGFGEDESRFSRVRRPDGSARYVLLSAEFLFRQGDLTDPIRDEALARSLGLEVGQRAPLGRVRDTVLAAAG